MRYIIMLSVLVILSSCGAENEHKIAVVPEASGIDYCVSTGTLAVANDEGVLYEISREGEILKEVKIGKYDLEGVVCTGEDFLLAVEDRGVLRVSRDFGKTEFLSIEGLPKGLSLFEKKHGVEAIAKNGSAIYLSKQNKKSKNNIIVELELKQKRLVYRRSIVHDIPDVAGLVYRKGRLYMVSDKKDTLAIYDLKKSKIVRRIELSKFAQEGITFDEQGFVYFADDDGFVRRAKESEFDF